MDSIYTFVSDSVLNDPIWTDSVISLIKDSIDSDVSSISYANDTVYLTRFAAPFWIEDAELVGIPVEKLQLGQWQLV